jgi:hypothetical protein
LPAVRTVACRRLHARRTPLLLKLLLFDKIPAAPMPFFAKPRPRTVPCDLAYLCDRPHDRLCGETSMSKGMDRKKETKKKPAKSLEEKRAAKREKKAARG